MFSEEKLDKIIKHKRKEEKEGLNKEPFDPFETERDSKSFRRLKSIKKKLEEIRKPKRLEEVKKEIERRRGFR